MNQEFLVVVGSVLTLFLLMAVGYGLKKKDILTSSMLPKLSTILLYIVSPAIILDCFQVERSAALDYQLMVGGMALVGTYVLYILLSFLVFRRQDADLRGVLRFASIYGNTGFMGLPLIQAVLGNEAVMVTVISMGVFNVATWTHGVANIGGRQAISLKKAVVNPGVISFAVALVLYLVNFTFPWPVGNVFTHLAGLNTPLAMLVIGAQMASADFRAVFSNAKLYGVCFLKLIVVPVITILVLLPFRLDGMIFMTVVILSACPTAGNTNLFCQLFHKDSTMAAQQVTLSTLLCIITLPLITILAQMVSM